MSDKNAAVFGIYPMQGGADAAVDALKNKGFRPADISVLAGGAIDGTTGALIGQGVPEYQARRYEGRVRDGGLLLSVHADDHEWARKGRKILEQTGAEDIASTGETQADFATSDAPTAINVRVQSVDVVVSD